MNNSQNQILQSYKDFWVRYIDVNGRSKRPDFWHPFWINFLISSVLGAISGGLLTTIFGIAMLIPAFTVMVRRLHDTDRTMILAIVSYFSSLITTMAAGLFILTVLALASSGNFGLIGAAIMASAVGTLVGGVITLYTLFVLIKPGNKGVNRFGTDGSCEVIEQIEQF